MRRRERMSTALSARAAGNHLPLSPPPISDSDLVRSLLAISREISASEIPAGSIHRRDFTSAVRKSKLISLLFEELLRGGTGAGELPRRANLCFMEFIVILKRFKSLLADCASRSRTLLLLQSDSVSYDFHELGHDLSTLLDILPLSDLDVGDDIREIVALLRRQCLRSGSPEAVALRREVLAVIREIEGEIVPDRTRLERIFDGMGLCDAGSCRDEIERLEREIAGDRAAEPWAATMLAVAGLVRYGKCVLFGAGSTPRSDSAAAAGKPVALHGSSDLAVPADFRCPISLDLMRDPVVVVATGQTYDRDSIAGWFSSGHTTCPKTGQSLADGNLVPNRALRNLISRWCRDENVTFDDPAADPGGGAANNKAALEAARMTAAFLVQRLAASPSPAAANHIVHELHQLAKSGGGGGGEENRAFVAEAGAIPLLLPLLRSTSPDLQLNAVTALLHLSALEANKKRIMYADGGVDSFVHVLSKGETWLAQGNAAATLLSLCSNTSYRRRLGRNRGVAAGLVALVELGPACVWKDALSAIHGLAGVRDNIPILLDEGVAELALTVVPVAEVEVSEAAVAVVAALAKRGGAEALVTSRGSAVAKLVGVLKRGSDLARENAAAALLMLCRKSGDGAAVAEAVAATPGVEWAICELMSSGTERARRKAASLGRVCRKWAAAGEVAAAAAEGRSGRF